MVRRRDPLARPQRRDDAVYAYDLESGERVEEREFELDEANRAPRGVASDGVTMWIADSGRDKLFAHDLGSGERLPDSDLVLHRDNAAPRGIWSDGVTMWVLDGGDDALFAYDLANGELIAGVRPARRQRRPARPLLRRCHLLGLQPRPETSLRLTGSRPRTTANWPSCATADEEFTELSRAGNNSPRGIWSDGGVMYVADESDERIYSYNMPDAIDTRLASLTLGGVQFGEFLPRRTEYEGVADEGVTETTVEAVAVQSGAKVAIDPPDADEAADGHQLALGGVEEITVTVTSADGSRERVYRVRLVQPGTPAGCLHGTIAVGFSLVVATGGSVDDIDACARSRDVAALYTLGDGEWVSYIVGAPDFVNAAFGGRFTDGVPSLTPLIAKSEGPPSADPAGIPEVTEPWPDCLRGEVGPGLQPCPLQGGQCRSTRRLRGELGRVCPLHPRQWRVGVIHPRRA